MASPLSAATPYGGGMLLQSPATAPLQQGYPSQSPPLSPLPLQGFSQGTQLGMQQSPHFQQGFMQGHTLQPHSPLVHPSAHRPNAQQFYTSPQIPLMHQQQRQQPYITYVPPQPHLQTQAYLHPHPLQQQTTTLQPTHAGGMLPNSSAFNAQAPPAPMQPLGPISVSLGKPKLETEKEKIARFRKSLPPPEQIPDTDTTLYFLMGSPLPDGTREMTPSPYAPPQAREKNPDFDGLEQKLEEERREQMERGVYPKRRLIEERVVGTEIKWPEAFWEDAKKEWPHLDTVDMQGLSNLKRSEGLRQAHTDAIRALQDMKAQALMKSGFNFKSFAIDPSVPPNCLGPLDDGAEETEEKGAPLQSLSVRVGKGKLLRRASSIEGPIVVLSKVEVVCNRNRAPHLMASKSLMLGVYPPFLESRGTFAQTKGEVGKSGEKRFVWDGLKIPFLAKGVIRIAFKSAVRVSGRFHPGAELSPDGPPQTQEEGGGKPHRDAEGRGVACDETHFSWAPVAEADIKAEAFLVGKIPPPRVALLQRDTRSKGVKHEGLSEEEAKEGKSKAFTTDLPLVHINRAYAFPRGIPVFGPESEPPLFSRLPDVSEQGKEKGKDGEGRKGSVRKEESVPLFAQRMPMVPIREETGAGAEGPEKESTAGNIGKQQPLVEALKSGDPEALACVFGAQGGRLFGPSRAIGRLLLTFSIYEEDEDIPFDLPPPGAATSGALRVHETVGILPLDALEAGKGTGKLGGNMPDRGEGGGSGSEGVGVSLSALKSAFMSKVQAASGSVPLQPSETRNKDQNGSAPLTTPDVLIVPQLGSLSLNQPQKQQQRGAQNHLVPVSEEGGEGDSPSLRPAMGSESGRGGAPSSLSSASVSAVAPMSESLDHKTSGGEKRQTTVAQKGSHSNPTTDKPSGNPSINQMAAQKAARALEPFDIFTLLNTLFTDLSTGGSTDSIKQERNPTPSNTLLQKFPFTSAFLQSMNTHPPSPKIEETSDEERDGPATSRVPSLPSPLVSAESEGARALLCLLGVSLEEGSGKSESAWKEGDAIVDTQRVRCASRHLHKGLTQRGIRCSVCLFLTGFLLSIKHPGVVLQKRREGALERTGWPSSASLTVAGPPTDSSFDDETGVLSVFLPLEERHRDPVGSLYSQAASRSPLPLAALAHVFRTHFGLSGPSLSSSSAVSRGDGAEGGLNGSGDREHERKLEEEPEGPLVKRESPRRKGSPDLDSCRGALKRLSTVANEALSHELYLFPQATGFDEPVSEEGGGRRAGEGEYAEFVKSAAGQGDIDAIAAEGDLFYNGHLEGGYQRNVPQALQRWERAARAGHGGAAMARAAVHLENPGGGGGGLQGAEDWLRLVDRAEFGVLPGSKPMAKYLLHKHGFEGSAGANSTEGFRFLQQAAEEGDGQAQLLLGHAYSGADTSILPEEERAQGPKTGEAMRQYRRAMDGGRQLGRYNVAVLTLQGVDPSFREPLDRCHEAASLFFPIGASHRVVKVMSALMAAFWRRGEQQGAAVIALMLSEMGIGIGHWNAAVAYGHSQKTAGRQLRGMLQGLIGGGSAKSSGVVPGAGTQRCNESGEADAWHCQLRYLRRLSVTEGSDASLMTLVDSLLDRAKVQDEEERRGGVDVLSVNAEEKRVGMFIDTGGDEMERGRERERGKEGRAAKREAQAWLRQTAGETGSERLLIELGSFLVSDALEGRRRHEKARARARAEERKRRNSKSSVISTKDKDGMSTMTKGNTEKETKEAEERKRGLSNKKRRLAKLEGEIGFPNFSSSLPTSQEEGADDLETRIFDLEVVVQGLKRDIQKKKHTYKDLAVNWKEGGDQKQEKFHLWAAEASKKIADLEGRLKFLRWAHEERRRDKRKADFSEGVQTLAWVLHRPTSTGVGRVVSAFKLLDLFLREGVFLEARQVLGGIVRGLVEGGSLKGGVDHEEFDIDVISSVWRAFLSPVGSGSRENPISFSSEQTTEGEGEMASGGGKLSSKQPIDLFLFGYRLTFGSLSRDGGDSIGSLHGKSGLDQRLLRLWLVGLSLVMLLGLRLFVSELLRRERLFSAPCVPSALTGEEELSVERRERGPEGILNADAEEEAKGKRTAQRREEAASEIQIRGRHWRGRAKADNEAASSSVEAEKDDVLSASSSDVSLRVSDTRGDRTNRASRWLLFSSSVSHGEIPKNQNTAAEQDTLCAEGTYEQGTKDPAAEAETPIATNAIHAPPRPLKVSLSISIDDDEDEKESFLTEGEEEEADDYYGLPNSSVLSPFSSLFTKARESPSARERLALSPVSRTSPAASPLHLTSHHSNQTEGDNQRPPPLLLTSPLPSPSGSSSHADLHSSMENPNPLPSPLSQTNNANCSTTAPEPSPRSVLSFVPSLPTHNVVSSAESFGVRGTRQAGFSLSLLPYAQDTEEATGGGEEAVRGWEEKDEHQSSGSAQEETRTSRNVPEETKLEEDRDPRNRPAMVFRNISSSSGPDGSAGFASSAFAPFSSADIESDGETGAEERKQREKEAGGEEEGEGAGMSLKEYLMGDSRRTTVEGEGEDEEEGE
uniref:Uncharacterized protein n=1 Tax=Chromera velia CCMP2878 TaxID=1169474 RepID=A0A0G4GJV7_9ALVE|eukprot:Cvel_22216.t1-p1 / transcript=Cvel_22216.t1 / gene=Cvel_22216 / organism=Chromera_velia_CCMP2878 / gene_product=hypothetical protein / transcript_product=hypothetical protein / location=Cvel_scaffold2160:1599-19177(-) / protein_length=2534 / sequence_SO=supercontig / SO=protein_coding / is_pseudo=false